MAADGGTPVGRYVIIGVLAAAALLIGLTNGRILGLSVSTTPEPRASATASGTAAPAPTGTPKPPLLQTADFEFVTPYLTGQDVQASTDIEDYWAGELASGATDNDDHFIDWAADRVTDEPTSGQRTAERTQVDAITQSARAQLASEWLSVHGCRDAWIALVDDSTPVPGEDTTGPVRSELDQLLTLAAKVASTVQAKFDKKAAQASPCGLRTTPVRKDCECQFPSAAATMSAAARTYLDARDSAGSSLYGIMEKQVDTGMIYAGLELPSDIKAGAYLGYLVGSYYLTSHGYEDAPDADAAVGTAP
jgi:hypothetical protein